MEAVDHLVKVLVQPGISRQEFESDTFSGPHVHGAREDRTLQAAQDESNFNLCETREVEVRAGFNEAAGFADVFDLAPEKDFGMKGDHLCKAIAEKPLVSPPFVSPCLILGHAGIPVRQPGQPSTLIGCNGDFFIEGRMFLHPRRDGGRLQ